MSKRTYLQQRVKVKAHFYYSLHESVHKLLLFYNSATASNKIIKIPSEWNATTSYYIQD